MKVIANKGFDKETFKKSVVDNVKNLYRRTIDEATPNQVFQAVAYAVKDVIIDEWIATHKEYEKKGRSQSPHKFVGDVHGGSDPE